MEWIANKKLHNLIEKSSHYQKNNNVNISNKNIKSLFSPKFYIYDGNIIVSNTDKSDLLLNTETAKLLGETCNIETEAWCNETRINDYFNSQLNIYDAINFSLISIEIWLAELKKIVPERKFCFILGCDKNYVTFRFHQYLTNEIWISENLERFFQATGYFISS